jgi:CheY-like chemotaxis protein
MEDDNIEDENKEVDFFLLDLEMPILDGYETLNKLIDYY